MRKVRDLLSCLLALILCFPFALPGAARGEQEPAEQEPAAVKSDGIQLTLIPQTATSFTNVLLHYVYFDAEVRNADKLTLRLYNPEGEQSVFRTRRHVDNGIQPSRSAGYTLKKGQEKYENLNILFQSGLAEGIWTIEVIASGDKKEPVTQRLEIEIKPERTLRMNQLPQVHGMLLGMDGGEVVPVEAGKVRYIAQDPADSLFVDRYWFGPAYDLRPTANQKCTRAVFSMALSWLGIDCTPVGMSEMLRNRELSYTYDQVCEALGNVKRLTGDLETLWESYQRGECSPVLLHFQYNGGMHAVLLVARDEEDPELFYAVTSGQRVNTSLFPGGLKRDMVIPILIEKGEIGQWIQSPLLKRYHKGKIDQIWTWTKR